MDATMLRRHHQPAPSLLDGHDAVHGFCPVCGSVAPCYRARRAVHQSWTVPSASRLKGR